MTAKEGGSGSRGARGQVVSGRVRNEAVCMIEADGELYCIDPAGDITSALGKKWTLPLIGILGNRPGTRFRDVREALEGVGSKALSDRLRELARLGLVSRKVFAEVPARVEYRLTPKGMTLRMALVPLLRWASTEEVGPRVPPGEVFRGRGVDPSPR